MFSQVQHVGAYRSQVRAVTGAPRLLVLLREDLLAMALSLERARRSGQYHYGESDRDTAHEAIDVDVPRMIADIRWMEAQNRHIQSFTQGLPHHRIRYEDFGDWDRVMAGVLAYLDLEPAGPLAPALRKIGSKAPREEIANFDALTEALARNGLGHLAR
jgi:LPS sulfotransferase NodH